MFYAVFLFSEIAALKVALTVVSVLADLRTDYARSLNGWRLFSQLFVGFLACLEGKVVVAVGWFYARVGVFVGLWRSDVEFGAFDGRLRGCCCGLFRSKLDQLLLLFGFGLAGHREVLEDFVEVLSALFELPLTLVQLLLSLSKILSLSFLAFLNFHVELFLTLRNFLFSQFKLFPIAFALLLCLGALLESFQHFESLRKGLHEVVPNFVRGVIVRLNLHQLGVHAEDG